jgi:hypothetical protein
MVKDRPAIELESLSSDMFAPLTERDASLVIGGQIDIYYYECLRVSQSTTIIGFDDGSVLIIRETTVEYDQGIIIVES